MSESASGEATGSSDAADKDSSIPKYKDAEFLRHEYHTKNQSLPQIADSVGVCSETIRSWMVRLDIPRRDRSSNTVKAQKGANENLSNREWLKEQYVTNKKSMTQLADELGVTEAGVLYWVRKHGIQTRTPQEAANSGEDHYAWVGGHPAYYGKNWREQRQKALERDGHECRVCGKGENLHVHHVHKIRSFSDPTEANYLDNLVTLCQNCHKKWEGIPLKPL